MSCILKIFGFFEWIVMYFHYICKRNDKPYLRIIANFKQKNIIEKLKPSIY